MSVWTSASAIRSWATTARPPRAQMAGLKNGALLAAAEAAGFDVLVTTDQEIPFQQELAGRRVAVVILSAPTNLCLNSWC